MVRIWHGRTRRDRADAYAEFLVARALPDYRSVAGNRAVHLLRRDAGEETHFLTVTLWDSEEAVRAFAGDDVLRAKYYPEDADFLLEFEPEVVHYSVIASSEVPQEASGGQPTAYPAERLTRP
jgi:heme-degrading monooxygenase HmoA